MLKINFLGDSITEGAAASKVESTYVFLVGQMLNAESRNYGIGGSRIADTLVPSCESRYDMFFGDRVAKMNNDADYVVVFGGTNDYGHGTVPFGTLGDKKPNTFYGAMDYLINELLRFYKKEQITFILPLYRQNEESLFGEGNKKEPDHTLEEYREVMREVLNKYAIDIFDIKDDIGKAENNPLIADGLHPNDKGHKKIAELVANHIKARINK